MQRRHRQRGEQRATLAAGLWQNAERGRPGTAGRRVRVAQGPLRGNVRGEGAQALRDDPATAAAQGTIAATARSVEGKRLSFFFSLPVFFRFSLTRGFSRAAEGTEDPRVCELLQTLKLHDFRNESLKSIKIDGNVRSIQPSSLEKEACILFCHENSLAGIE